MNLSLPLAISTLAIGHLALLPSSAGAQQILIGFEEAEGYTGGNGSSIAGQEGWSLGESAFTLNTTTGYQSGQSLNGNVPAGGATRTESAPFHSEDFSGLSLYFSNPTTSYQNGTNILRLRILLGTQEEAATPALLRRLEFSISYTGNVNQYNLAYNVHNDLLPDKRGTAYQAFPVSTLNLADWNQLRFEADFDAPSGPAYSLYLNDVVIVSDIGIYQPPASSARLYQLQFWSHAANGNSYAGTVLYDAISGIPYQPIPEPATALVFGGGILSLWGIRRWRK